MVNNFIKLYHIFNIVIKIGQEEGKKTTHSNKDERKSDLDKQIL